MKLARISHRLSTAASKDPLLSASETDHDFDNLQVAGTRESASYPRNHPAFRALATKSAKKCGLGLKIFVSALLYLNACIFAFPEEIKTLEDIRNALKLPPKTSSGAASKKQEKKKFEIKSMRVGAIPGFEDPENKRGAMTVQGVEVTLRVNEKGDTLAVPFCVCYFYDKDKNLVERRKVQYLYPEGSFEPKELDGDLFIKGKKDTRVIFECPTSTHFKFALCVIGNDTTVDAETLPKSFSPDDFDFDEKELFHAG